MDERDYAERFALEHADYTQDLRFWRSAAARLGSPVLDLGAACGRVALALARDGLEVWALDRSQAMLDELARRSQDEPIAVRERVHAVRGDLCTFDLGERFALIAIAMNTLQVLLDPEDRHTCLRAVRAHLAPGGELIFDVALPDRTEIEETMGLERLNGEYHDPDAGVTVVQSAWYESYQESTGTLEFAVRIEDRIGADMAEVRTRRHRVHVFSRAELGGLLAAAGLRALSVDGDFEGGPVGVGSERQVYRCVAAEEAE